MIKTAGELIAEAQTQIDCVDVVSAKTLYDNAENPVIIDGRGFLDEKKFDDGTYFKIGYSEQFHD